MEKRALGSYKITLLIRQKETLSFMVLCYCRTGSDHVREKDGIWAALAWLQILAVKKWTVEQTLKDFWSIYGRNFFTRYDYEECAAGPCNDMMAGLQAYVDDKANVGRSYESMGKTFVVSTIDNFSYTDPVDASVTTKQVSQEFHII